LRKLLILVDILNRGCHVRISQAGDSIAARLIRGPVDPCIRALCQRSAADRDRAQQMRSVPSCQTTILPLLCMNRLSTWTSSRRRLGLWDS
jgi:hypothetical protein